jgi:hypothetical protein
MNHFYLIQIIDTDGTHVAQRYARTHESALKIARRYLSQYRFEETTEPGEFKDYEFQRSNCLYEITYCTPTSERAENAPTFVSFIERIEITE